MQDIQIPTVTPEDLVKFQKDHFPSAHQTYPHPLVYPDNEEHGDEEVYEEDDLGYYEDGVKRTLTDEQIRIFRHSEIHNLLRERERQREETEEEDRLLKGDESSPERDDSQGVGGDGLAAKMRPQKTAQHNAEKRERDVDANTEHVEQNETLDDKGRVTQKARGPVDSYAGRKIVSYSDD
ncbi:hypothetical protein BGW36DRAFT_433801 [Talaromyces proteolyticus]|uniref:Uncharacterized protein n=1 Tax=Talaromyces proteolyticus TaxID=1131652 RepID=A0AAD4KEN0_9EURO|nr:uncharacterized protein BGW36DRAFT_433801 [Talaromyces proteolyticus]KAH8689038.1 hypothetical protein BGW36DRAFT_433801 [Talaromyces proteolyticus]